MLPLPRCRLPCALRGARPHRRYPALVEPGYAPLTQSLAILEYLDEVAPAPPLLPADPHGRARVRSLALMLAADTHPLITPRVKKYLTGKGVEASRISGQGFGGSQPIADNRREATRRLNRRVEFRITRLE